MQDRNTPTVSAKTTPYRTLEGNVKVGGLSMLEKDPVTDGSIEGEGDGDTMNELSMSQAVLEEAPFPDNMDRKRSVNVIGSQKDYPLTAQTRLE